MHKIIVRFRWALISGGILAVSALFLTGLSANSESADVGVLPNSLASQIVDGRTKSVDHPSLTDIPEAEYKKRLARIKQLADGGNFFDLVNEGDEIIARWGNIGGERFAKLILELTSSLGLSRILDEHPDARDLREKYAIAALATSDSYSVDSELHLVLKLRYSGNAINFNDIEALKSRDNSKLWLHLLARIESEKDPSISLDPHQSLPRHLITPVELRMVEMKDPLAAAKLRAAEAAHHEKLRKITYQFQLQDYSELAERIGTKFLANVYSRPPFSREELKVLLSEYQIAESLRTNILGARDEFALKSTN